ncbi:RagB/SusD family nutrient uptake outer membrane protein [Dyadobacter sp. CY323]|uniref:RagB/SusD family nutrient uptake outer membrane protein n=1 Tax=Dyadobacter sp. CY323 TaxID=2907302 RepID=UPI001F230905|nr:RagB/SusD family nutrient uptake outer membrane protein [Dyadobacter sp. CY323]MCE6991995.1 RagB/SusD family nutrient uptake outer membrane protein [Dyadobacter sp. CY323]
MKKILFTTLISAFLVTGCNDNFLERFPEDKISDGNFWKTGADFKMYAAQFYPNLYDARLAWYTLDNFSDNQVPSSRNPYTWGEYPIPSSGGGWDKADWLPIRKVNYALDRIAGVPEDAALKLAHGELRFFRAFFYFDKLKKFGEVPWIESSLDTESEELVAPRDSRETVVNKMLADLDFAIQSLPETSTEDRVTKFAALTLKGDIALYEGTFRKYQKKEGDYLAILKKAVEAYEAVISSGRFGVWSTGNPAKDYFDLFVQYELKGNPEGILVQRYITDKRMHNNVRQLGEPYTGYSKDFVESYLCIDGLPIALSPLYKGDANFADEFINRDPRMDQSVYQSKRPYRIFDDGSTTYKPMPEFQNNYSPTSYFIIKGYSPYERDRLPSTSTTDDFVFRYGKLLVSYAEAKAELGECTQAVLDKTVNLLRDRVKMPHLKAEVGFVDPNWPKWEVAITPLLNEIRRERRLETCAEGIRWDDLVRWGAGKLLENPKTMQGAKDPATKANRVIYPGITARTWNNKLYLYPIPLQETALNPSLTQNPGW